MLKVNFQKVFAEIISNLSALAILNHYFFYTFCVVLQNKTNIPVLQRFLHTVNWGYFEHFSCFFVDIFKNLSDIKKDWHLKYLLAVGLLNTNDITF